MRKFILVLLILVVVIFPSLPQVFHKNSGESVSLGTEGKGKLVNGYKLPYQGKNFRYFSLLDYYILGRCYVHSDIYDIVIESYAKLEESDDGYTFRIMECSRKRGGRSFPHRTHQNGVSIDFMTPLKKNGESIKRFDHFGIFRYAMQFDEDGKKGSNSKIEIDFEKMARHILTLNEAAGRKGYRIGKVILETNLKDEIYRCSYGDELKKSGIYFVNHLPERINKLHDDHYHINFAKL